MDKQIKDTANTKDISLLLPVDNMSLYVLKKVEKISYALYLITNHLPLEEPFRRHLRDQTLKLVSDLYSQSLGFQNSSQALLTILRAKFSELDAVLKVGVAAGLMSEMNYSVLLHEMHQLVEQLSDYSDVDKDKHVLSEKFFSTPVEPSAAPTRPVTVQRSPAPQSASKHTEPASNAGAPKKRNGNNHHKRQDKILSLFKMKDSIDIKDVEGVIEGCSQKTMQRELRTLVDSGVLKKHGKRRWSTYTLTNPSILENIES